MSTAVKRIEDILTSEFEMNSYVELVREIFSSVKLVAPDKMKPEFSNFSSHVAGSAHVGNYETPDSEKIAIFAVELKQQTYVENSRSTQRSYAKKLIENGGCDAALIAFYTPNDKDKKWRLSFVVLDYEMKIENGKMKTEEKLTPARRYSFLVGENEPCHTAISRFGKFIRDNNSQPTLPEMEDAFSVEAVTKEFFDLYCEKFYQLVEYLETNDAFKGESERCGFTTEQFAKKLMGQIVFLYFLQKKGWLGVGVWSPRITEKEYKDIFYTSRFSAAQKEQIQKYLPMLYVPFEGGYKFKGIAGLDSIPDDVEENIANAMPGDRNWGSGSKTFLRTWFDWAARHDGKFYDNYLEPLFYATLNKNRGDLGYSTVLHCRVPFLSGGLFDPIDGYDWEHTNFNIPDEIFSNKKTPDDLAADGILDIFDRYNFTMSEDEPMEREVAIDPEMLGKVFENLLDVKDRKSKGAFYTPREIVHYMCQESLVNYLTTNMDISEGAIRNFILYGDFYKDADTEKTLRVNEANGKYHMEFDINRELKISPEIFDPKAGVDRIGEIDEMLKNIRVADPAVGSGAFPLGMLNEIVRARQNCTAYMATKMSSYNSRLMYVNERSAHTLKYETIRNCIFAADIEPSAVDIAQLRLWLALVIDDEINPNAQTSLDGHRNPLPLPNLECNIVCGNTLSSQLSGHRLIPQSSLLGTEEEGQEFSWNQMELETLIPKLISAQDRLFKCDDPIKKEQIKIEILTLKDTIIHAELECLDEETLRLYEESKLKTSKPYVLWQVDFARVFQEKKGFDIVIGNPPYGADLDEETKKYYRTKYDEVQFKIDSYVLFIIKGLELCNRGELSYIIPNTLLNNYFLADLRKKMINEMNIQQLINFDNSVFEAVVHSLIFHVHKGDHDENHEVLMAWNLDDRKHYQKQKEFLENENVAYEFNDGKESLLSKLKNRSIRLEEVLDLRQAIKSGNDKVYITPEPVGNAKKILRGKDVFRYRITNPCLYLNYGKHLACPRDEEIFNQPHILIREAGKVITATLDLENYYIMSSLYCGIIKDNSFSIKYLIGLINSKLFQYLMYKVNFENTQGAFTKAKIYHYNQLPVVKPDNVRLAKIEEMVERLMEKEGDDQEADEAIDELIFEIYELSDEEITEILNMNY